uniref:Ig-like domain-containing protein n=1 Tax=Lates calcarifer TaxID=8187 RepID=A0A4W6CVM2_LATCA
IIMPAFSQYTLMSNFIQSTTVHQDTAFISANVGDNLTLRCFYDSDAVKYYWYKQTLGQKLQLISNAYKFDKSVNFHDEFKDNPRFTLETNAGMNHLKISDVQPSDSATYYCARDYLFMFEFAEGTIVKPESFSCWDLLLCCCLMWTHTVWKWNQAGH